MTTQQPKTQGVSFEQMIQDTIQEQFTTGAVQEKVQAYVDEFVKRTLDSVFSSYSPASKTLTNQLEDVTVDIINKQFTHIKGAYTVALEEVFNQAYTEMSKPQERLLSGMRNIFTKSYSTANDNTSGARARDKFGRILWTIFDVLNQYETFVSENIDTSEIDVCTDDEPYYEHATIELALLRPSESVSFKDHHSVRFNRDERLYVIALSCEQDASLYTEILIEEARSTMYRVQSESASELNHEVIYETYVSDKTDDNPCTVFTVRDAHLPRTEKMRNILPMSTDVQNQVLNRAEIYAGYRLSDDDKEVVANMYNISALPTPLSYLRYLSEFEVYVLRLMQEFDYITWNSHETHEDNKNEYVPAPLDTDCFTITREDVEIKEEPDCYY